MGLRLAITGQLNPVMMQLLASVDALKSSTAARNKRDREFSKVMAANTAVMKKLAKVEVSSGHTCGYTACSESLVSTSRYVSGSALVLTPSS